MVADLPFSKVDGRHGDLLAIHQPCFDGEIPAEWKLTVSAADYDRADIDAVDAAWINRRMERLGLKNKTVSGHTGIDKCTLSSIINGNKELTKWHKVAFYYFFKYYEAAKF